MPDIVKILLGLAGFGVLATIVMFILNIVAGRNNSASSYMDEDDEEEAESYTRSYSGRAEQNDEPLVFTPLGEDEDYGSEPVEEEDEEPETEDYGDDDESDSLLGPEVLTIYKKEAPKPEKKAWITPAVVEYEEPKTASSQEEPETQAIVPEKPEKTIEEAAYAEQPAKVSPAFAIPVVKEVPEKEEEKATAAPTYEPSGVEYASAIIGDIKVSVGNAQHIGTREQQQDAFAITPLEDRSVVVSHGVMAVVCDGMGGLQNGAEAANLGAVSFMQNYMRDDNVGRDSLLSAVTLTNSLVYDTFGGGDVPAGTTLAAASILPSGLRFVSVGDSHIYLFRRGRIYQINRDHNYFAELMEQVKAGKMTMQEAQNHPERAHLTSYVGLKKLELVDYNTEAVALREGDRVILCTDGLFKTLSLEEIASVVSGSYNYDAQDKLMNALLNKNKRRQDNVTIVVLYCDKV